jgi:hypothetical protein
MTRDEALKKLSWVRTSERKPEPDESGWCVAHDIACHPDGQHHFHIINGHNLAYYGADEYDYWLPLPPLPEVEG